MKRISVFISDPQYQHFQDLARLRDRPAAELIREALDRYLVAQQRIAATMAAPGQKPRRRPR